MASGLRGSAWTAVFKDTMLLGIVLFLGIYLPLHFYGGYEAMFSKIDQLKPQFLTLHGSKDVVWFDSTVSLTLLGFYMWPHNFGSVYSGRHEKVFRRNAIYLPLYQLVLLFVFFVGFAAIAQIPHLKNDDMALLKFTLATFPPWVVGLVGAAGLLAALVPGSMLMMATATAVARNIYQALHGSASDRQVASLAKWLVPIVALVAVYFTLAGGQGIVTLLLLGYSFVTQLFPTLLLSLFPRHFGTKQGAAAGIIVGVVFVAYLKLSHTTIIQLLPFLPAGARNINIGIVALILNTIVLVVVSLIIYFLRPAQYSSRRI
jgi:SSS family solute:Na+ symporter